MNRKQEVILFAMQEGMTSIEELEDKGYDIKSIFSRDKTSFMRLRTILKANKIREEEKARGRNDGEDR